MGSYVSIPTYMRSLQQRYRLMGQKCSDCETVNFPETAVCRNCGGRGGFESVPLPRKGKIVSFTVIEPGGAPSEFAEQVRLNGHYGVALIELDGGVRVLAQMTDADPYKMKVGDNVEAVIRVLYEQEGIIRYSFKFRPCVGNESEA